jgi:hypothetical protein
MNEVLEEIVRKTGGQWEFEVVGHTCGFWQPALSVSNDLRRTTMDDLECADERL